MVYTSHPNRRVAFIRRNPAVAIPLLLVFVACDVWLRLDLNNRHVTATQFLLNFLLVLLVVGVVLLVWMHRRSRRKQAI